MAGEALVLDPTSDDSTNTELVLSNANGYRLKSHTYPDPPEDSLWAGSIDTEGDRRAGAKVGNREIVLTLQLFGSTDAAFRTAQRNLDKKLGKLRREGGTLKRTLPNGDIIYFDIHTVTGGERLFDNSFIANKRAEDTLTLVCQPYGRGAVQTFSAASETSLPVLRITAASVKGDVDGLGKLLVDDLQAVDQFWLHWGIRNRYYSSDVDNALFYEAEGRTVLGGAATAVGTAPASGAGSNVVRQGTLTPGWQAMLSTQATGGGSHLEHIGVFEFWARVFMPTSNTGAVSIRLDWAEGDFRRVTSNPQVDFSANHAREGKWVIVSLGQVFLTKVAQGTQRWEGRIVAKSTVVGDDLDVDCFWLRPLSEGNSTARALVTFDTATSFSARDEFDQTAGALTGKTAPVGGVWAGAGDAGDFQVETTGKTAQRTDVSDVDVNTGRYAVSGVAGFAAQGVQIDAKTNAQTVRLGGVLARYVDVNNWFMAVMDTANSDFLVLKRVTGTVTTLASVDLGANFGVDGNYRTIRVVVDAAGRWFVWYFRTGALSGEPIFSGSDAVLATGGALASGKPGFYDAHIGAGAATRNYDNFQAWVPVADAAVFASQSMEIRHDRVIREDSGGTIWTPVSKYTGDYLRVPPAGMEGRTSEILVKASRNDPEWGDDSAIDDIRGTLSVTPRYLKVPDEPEVVTLDDFANLAGWWKNDDGTAGSWTDSSGNARHLIQGTAGLQPSIVAAVLNGYAVRRFDGVDDTMVAAFTSAQPHTRFWVVRYRSAFTSQETVSDGDTLNTAQLFRSASGTMGIYAGGATITTTTTPESWHVYSAVFNGASSSFRVDGGTAATGNPGTATTAGIQLGSTGLPGEYADVDVAEAAVYSDAKSDADVASIVSALMTKYAL